MHKYYRYNNAHSYEKNKTGAFKIKENELNNYYIFEIFYANNLSYKTKPFNIR